jgi:hypothetical protein
VKKHIILAGCLLVAAAASAQVVPQTIALANGWNAFYLRVDPGVGADEFFAAWPVDHVSLLDSGSFLRTAQFSTDAATEPVLEAAYRVWHRGRPGISTLKNVVGDRIYVCNASAPWNITVYGKPCVQRMAWHPASAGGGQTSLNFFGVTLEAGATVNPSQYLQGLPTGHTLKQVVAGGNPAVMGLLSATTIQDGAVLVMDAAKVSDWSGPLFLTPSGGLDFGDRQSLAVCSVRNDSPTLRTVSITYTRSQGPVMDLEPPLLEMLMKTPVNTWETVPLTMTNVLEPNQTWTLVLAIDRAQFHGMVGVKRAGIITVRDVDGGSLYCSRMPVVAVGGAGGAIATAEWPAGLWLAEIKMNRVTQFLSDTAREDGVPAGGTMPLRAILHVDLDGNLKLLQRVLIATREDEDRATVSLHLSDASIPTDASVSRLSTVDMGVDNQIVAAEAASEFRQSAEFHFLVDASDRSNPFRHAYHPDHDGLQWDFTTPAPSGDDIANYVGAIKPETFSVSNVVSFTWSEKAGEIAVWDPQETLAGECRWELHGLRRQGPIHVEGPFTMRRISTVGALTP